MKLLSMIENLPPSPPSAGSALGLAMAEIAKAKEAILAAERILERSQICCGRCGVALDLDALNGYSVNGKRVCGPCYRLLA